MVDTPTELTLVKKAQWLGQTLIQLHDHNLLLHAQAQPTTLLEQVAERKASLEEIATQFSHMKQEAKFIMEETTQFWQSIVQDEQLDQLTVQVQEEEGQLKTLNSIVKAMPLMVQIT